MIANKIAGSGMFQALKHDDDDNNNKMVRKSDSI